MKKNVSGQVVGAQLVNKTDGTAVTTGITTCYVTGDGGAQAQGAGGVGSPTIVGECVHEGNGFWTYTPTQAETNYDHVGFTFVNASAVNATVQIYTSYPQSGDHSADAFLDRDMSAGTDSGGRTVRNALRFLRNRWVLSAGSLSVKKEDDTTEAWSATVSTDVAANPVTGTDPA